MREFGKIGQHHQRVSAGIVLAAQFVERAANVALHQRFEQVNHAGAVGQTQHVAYVLRTHGSRGMRDRLIEQRERVAYRTFGGASNQCQRLRLGGNLLLGGDAFEVLDQHRIVDPPQVEALAARQHRDRHLANFGGGEDEFDVCRRLFQRLQQGVEGLRRQHVHFVEDIDLVARADRGVARRVGDLAHIIDAVVRRSVHLQHVDMLALHDRLTMDAKLRHRDSRAADRPVGKLVIERARQDTRRRGLADAAHAGEDPGLRDASALERIRDGAHHGLLADQVVEGRRPVFARQHAIGRRGAATRRLTQIETRFG